MKTIAPHSASTYTLDKDSQGETISTKLSTSNLSVQVPNKDFDEITVKLPDRPGDTVMHEHHLYTHHKISILIDK